MNKVISREYVEKNYIEKSKFEEYIDKKIDELSKIHNNSKNGIEREIAKSMAVFATLMKEEILEETKDENSNTTAVQKQKEQSTDINKQQNT